jgi:predicted nucleotidyltransferase
MQKTIDRLKSISKRLKKDYHAQKIILYGSHARGKRHPKLTLIYLLSPRPMNDFLKA